MSKKLYIKTHGCQMNEYDSARMRDLLGERCDLVPTENPEEADVLLLNTCSIREKAQEKVFIVALPLPIMTTVSPTKKTSIVITILPSP